MNFQVSREHWFSFGDSCVAVSEFAPARYREPTRNSLTLFFLHGRFGQGEIWEPVVSNLASQYRCYFLDFPGFGRSFSVKGRGTSLLEQSNLIQSIVQRFVQPGERAILVGHDTGGAVAQLCALRDPKSLAGLVLINSAALTQAARDFGTGPFCIYARLLLGRLMRGVASKTHEVHFSALARAWASRTGRSSMADVFRMWELTWPGPFERQTWKNQIQNLNAPVLLLWGAQDLVNPPETAEELMRYLPEAYMFEDNRSGHWPNLENPEWVESKMREFIFRLQPPVAFIRAMR